MAALSTNFSTAFLGQKLPSNRLSAEATPRAVVRIPRCEAEGHGRSGGLIRAAFRRLPMASSQNRKETKISLKSRWKKRVEESPPWVKILLDFVELPPPDAIFERLFLFEFIRNCCVECGPDVMVAFSLAACIYFLYRKMRSLRRAFVIGLATRKIGLACGSIIVPIVVLLRPTWDPELVTSLVTRAFLFLSCTFLK